MRQFIRYYWGTIARPRETFEALAAEAKLRWAILLAAVSLLQGWGNIGLHAALGLDWLGTRPILTDPTYVGGFGHLRVALEHWVPIFAALLPLLGLFNLVIIPGTAQLMSRLWNGRGSFEQMVTVLTFATGVPALTIGATSEWLFSAPMSLLSGHDYWWVAAMAGEFGPVVGTVWNAYVIGIYATLQYAWAMALGSLAIRRVQKVPLWAAVVTMLVSFGTWMVIVTTFVR
ncbi:MAG: YIP1 family protein [Anaerolineae bacterium]|jgi:hypothetical protein